MIQAPPHAQAHALPTPALTAAIIRRLRDVASEPLAAEVDIVEPARAWIADVRFFLTCYAAGLVFFLVMLS